MWVVGYWAKLVHVIRSSPTVRSGKRPGGQALAVRCLSAGYQANHKLHCNSLHIHGPPIAGHCRPARAAQSAPPLYEQIRPINCAHSLILLASFLQLIAGHRRPARAAGPAPPLRAPSLPGLPDLGRQRGGALRCGGRPAVPAGLCLPPAGEIGWQGCPKVCDGLLVNACVNATGLLAGIGYCCAAR